MSAGAPAKARPTSRPRLLPWRIERPVLIIAPPRSGSTLLFECLARFPELRTFTDKEGTYLWRRVMPYRLRAEHSDALSPAEFGSFRRAQIKALFYGRSLVKDDRVRPINQLVRVVRQPAMRYLDKSIGNAFRLPLLAEMFPDATFVHLVRDPRPNIASMIEGWSTGWMHKPTLQPWLEEAGSELPGWAFAVPSGWQRQLHRSLPEVCAWMWQQHVEAILDWRERVPDPGPLIRYEDLVADTAGVVRGLADQLDLDLTPSIAEALASPPPSRTTNTRTSAQRRADVAAQAAEVLPQIAATAARVGY